MESSSPLPSRGGEQCLPLTGARGPCPHEGSLPSPLSGELLLRGPQASTRVQVVAPPSSRGWTSVFIWASVSLPEYIALTIPLPTAVNEGRPTKGLVHSRCLINEDHPPSCFQHSHPFLWKWPPWALPPPLQVKDWGRREAVIVPAVSSVIEVGKAGHLWEAQVCVGRGHHPCQLLLLLWFRCPDKHG